MNLFTKWTLVAVAFSLIMFSSRAQNIYVLETEDTTPISYEVTGSGEPALVFVHGWSCDSRYWREQVPVFSKDHMVVTIDLAGHGHSGFIRTNYTMKSFGGDVKSVVDEVGVSNVILIGHSMGGCVIGEAARQMPDKNVIGLIGVDTLQNVEYDLSEEQMQGMLTPLKEDFKSGCQAFVTSMLMPDTESPQRREWIISDMSSAPSNVAVSAINNMLSLYLTGDFAKIFDDTDYPVICINADKWPIDEEANRKHMHSYESIVVTNSDHFLQLNKSAQFNDKLSEAIQKLTDE